MPSSLVIESKKYAVYVRILAGEGDGPLIYIDSHGHIHVGPGDGGPLKERLVAAVKQIETGVAAVENIIGAAGHSKG